MLRHPSDERLCHSLFSRAAVSTLNASRRRAWLLLSSGVANLFISLLESQPACPGFAPVQLHFLRRIYEHRQ